MAKPLDSRSSSKFFQEDIVRRIDNPSQTGMVLRCWHDQEDLPIPVVPPSDPLSRPLQKGEVGVQFFPSNVRDILPESQFTLVDRAFQPGDVCKRSVDDVRSGVVLNVEVQARIQHAISGAVVEEWLGRDAIDTAQDVMLGDFVICDDWVGQIEEMFEEATVQLSGGTLYKFAELGGRFAVGDKGSDILPYTPSTSLMSLFGGRSRSASDTIIQLTPTVIACSWLAINQSLPPEQQQRPRPQRFWHGSDLSRLVTVHDRAERQLRVAERVVFKDPSHAERLGIAFTKHGKPNETPIEVRTFIVHQTRTTVEVLWQDGVTEKIPSTELIPYLNVDEYDCWPGDTVIWKGEDEKRVAVVQSTNAQQRTALVRWHGSEKTELVSVLELDPHGNSGPAGLPATDTFGVRRGDMVLLHREGTTNGAELPRVPRIGELEAWVREVPPSHDVKSAGWRAEMADIGMKVAEQRTLGTASQGWPRRGGDGVDWFGEVTHLRTDGLIEVTLPHGEAVLVPLQRLTLLQDGFDHPMEEMWDDDMHDNVDDGEYSDEEEGAMDVEFGHGLGGNRLDDDGMSEGSWETYEEGGRDAWEHMDTDEEAPDGHGEAKPVVTVEPPAQTEPSPPPPPPPSLPITPSTLTPALGSPRAEATPSPLAFPPPVASSSAIRAEDEDEEDSPWKRFSILAQCPPDHAFYSSTPAQTSKTFLSRLNKEYRVLQSSLPDTILVRAYEDRTDLLRCLIIGPENTPYEDAPFVIDWMLEGTFPQTPPIAHFLSWTNGNGRVNPNLYEEGKVCLSILGTWAGDRNESWSAARSSLLQAFVSIQGLVLVKEPWYCEPAFDRLRGTEEGIVNSRLYSEKAYVLARGFVRRALEIPLGGLEEEISWLYYTRGRLAKVLKDANALIEKSNAAGEAPLSEDEKDLAVPRLSTGGILTLNRTLSKLQALQESWLAKRR